MSASAPIGVFDSGVGGLSVLAHLREQLPGESMLYIADAAHAPYGEKSEAYITQRAIELTGFLQAEGVKAVVVACNTATAAALPALRAAFAFPIIGMEPALKPAAALSRSGVVGILATTASVKSARLSALITNHGAGLEVIAQACPGWVEHVEAGDIHCDAVHQSVQRYLRPLLTRGVDTLVLGCTHYLFLKPVIEAYVGPQVTIVDSGAAVARQTLRILREQASLCEAHDGLTSRRFFTSGDPQRFAQAMRGLYGERVPVEVLPGIHSALPMALDLSTQGC